MACHQSWLRDALHIHSKLMCGSQSRACLEVFKPGWLAAHLSFGTDAIHREIFSRAVAQHSISAGAAKCFAWRLLLLWRSCAAHAQSGSCGLQVFDMIEFSLVKRGWKNDGIVRVFYR